MSHSHNFIVSDDSTTLTDQTHFEIDPYSCSSVRTHNNNTSFSHSLGHFPTIQAAALTDEYAQRLSLSLGSRSHHMFDLPYNKQCPLNLNLHYLVSREEDKGEQEGEERNRSRTDPGMDQQNNIGNEYSSTRDIIGDSRYLKAAQCLLEEVVNIGGREVDLCNESLVEKMFRGGRRGGFGFSSEIKAELCSSGLMSSLEKHQLQIRIAKLVGLLEEVEGRYEKYYNQMEQVVASFEEKVGVGAATSYTGLALRAMTRHFSSLRDSIISQINAACRKLLHDWPNLNAGLSQLSLLGGNTRQGRVLSLQQLGLMQSQQRQAWRPIRGLPETSVAILRSWLFEHFLHPYPNDSEKLMLASQTGLSKNQVSNWFINARVRLWKPMIEEMYRDEFADSSDDSKPSPATADHAED